MLRSLRFSTALAVCAAVLLAMLSVAAQDAVRVTGLAAQHRGTIAFYTTQGAPEPVRTGHLVPAPFGNVLPASAQHAYYYLASRDYSDVDPASTEGLVGVAPLVGHAGLANALAAGQFAPADISFTTDLWSLGNDVRGQDWDLVNAVEWRDYAPTAGAKYHVLLRGQPLLEGPLPVFHMSIDYRVAANPLDDVTTGQTDASVPVDVSQNAAPAVRAVAAAWLADLNGRGLRFVFSSMQPAAQWDFSTGARVGAYFEAQVAQVEAAAMPPALHIASAPIDGVPITGTAQGQTPFDVAVPAQGGAYILSAPAYLTQGAQEYVFTQWRVNGVPQGAGVPRITVQVAQPVTVIADYAICDPEAVTDKIAFTRCPNAQGWGIWIMDRDGANQHALTDTANTDCNPCFRPDGKRIVFLRYYANQLGTQDLISMNADGTQLVVLAGTSLGESRPFMPKYSWDGAKIVYESNAGWPNGSDIWVMNADGTNKHAVVAGATFDLAPSFSPEGNWIVFQRDLSANNVIAGKICKVPVAGGAVVDLTDGATQDQTPVYTADGNDIIFERGVASTDLYRMPADHAPADQASIVNLTNAGFMVGAPQCAWGDMKVAYFTSSTGGLSETEIWVRDTNGGDPVRLTDNAVQDYDPTFSPSTASLRILSSPFTGVLISGDFAAATPFNAIMHGPADVALSAPAYVTLNGTEYVFTGWRVNGAVRNSGVPHIVVPVRGATIVIADYEVSAPAAAVDRIVFAREAGGFAHYNLWTMGRTGGDQRQVTAGIASDTNPCFRPDGKRVVFVRTYVGDPMRRDIVAMNPDGTQQVVLAGSSMGEPNPWSGPRYAWDGTQVVYTSTQDFSASTILIMRADGTGKHAVLPGVQYDVQPSFSPDGAWIVFSRDMNGGPAGMLPRPVICKVPVAGGDVVQLTDADDEEYPYVEDASPSYTVDGAHIVFVRHLFDPIGLYQGAKMRRMAVDHLPADHAGLEDISLGGTVVGTPQPAWDAQWIAYARAAQPGNLAMPDIWRMWADGAQGWSCDVTNTDERDPSFSPQTPAFQVTVQSTPIAGVPIAGEAPFAGATPFGHPVPDDGSVVTLTAPLAVEQNGRRYEFIRWQVNSAPQAAGVVRVQFTVDANTTAVAEYAPTVPTRVTLTVKPGLLVAQGVPIRLIATADAVNNVEYRFLVRPKNALLYSLVTAWQESATYLGWAPTAGTYAVVAEARARNAAARVASRATTVTVTKALSGVKLTDLSASKTTGRPAAFKASPLDGASVEYRFEARRVGDTTPVFVRDYVLDQAGTIWTPTLPGSYTMTVFAREQGTTTPVSAASTFTVSPALSALALARSAPPTVPTAVGVPLDFLATATGGGALEYQFLWNFSATLKVSPTWTKEAYGAGRGYTFRPTQPGVYTFRVYAREKGSTASFQAASSDVKITVNAAMGGFTVACTPGPSSVSIAAVGAVGGAQPRWKFWARKRGDASWTLLQDWQDSRTYADWHPTPGVYDVMVYMKEVGSRAATYDLSRTAVYTAP